MPRPTIKHQHLNFNYYYYQEDKMSEAQQRLSEIEAQEKALADEKAKLLSASKDADLDGIPPIL